MPIIGTFPVVADAAVFDATVQLDPAIVPKKAVQVETFTISGLTSNMRVIVDAPTLESGLFLLDAEASATDTLKLTFWNNTNAPINPASQDFVIKAF